MVGGGIGDETKATAQDRASEDTFAGTYYVKQADASRKKR
jgi:hypothetical protein